MSTVCSFALVNIISHLSPDSFQISYTVNSEIFTRFIFFHETSHMQFSNLQYGEYIQVLSVPL